MKTSCGHSLVQTKTEAKDQSKTAQAEWISRERSRASKLQKAAGREMGRALSVLLKQGLPPRQAILSERFQGAHSAQAGAIERLRWLNRSPQSSQ